MRDVARAHRDDWALAPRFVTSAEIRLLNCGGVDKTRLSFILCCSMQLMCSSVQCRNDRALLSNNRISAKIPYAVGVAVFRLIGIQFVAFVKRCHVLGYMQTSRKRRRFFHDP